MSCGKIGGLIVDSVSKEHLNGKSTSEISTRRPRSRYYLHSSQREDGRHPRGVDLVPRTCLAPEASLLPRIDLVPCFMQERY